MNLPVVSIVDIGIGNLFSISSILTSLDVDYNFIEEPTQLGSSDCLILPGVGAFSHAMAELHKRDFVAAIHDYAKDPSKKILGICLGFQLLGTSSSEITHTDGLGLIPAAVTRLLEEPNITVPHIGFNSVASSQDHVNSFLPHKDLCELDYYFVHSYCFSADQVVHLPDDAVYGLTSHGSNTFISAYQANNIFGTQFHPEKSQSNGLALFQNFLDL